MKEKLISEETAKLAKEKGFGFDILSSDEVKIAVVDTKYYKPIYFNYYYYVPEFTYNDYTFKEESGYEENVGTNSNFFGRLLNWYFYPELMIPNSNAYLCVTQSLLQKWLRENHNIHCMAYVYNRHPHLVGIGNEIRYIYVTVYPSEYGGYSCKYHHYHIHDGFLSYEEALEQNLTEGLNLIK
jgi:hypothetical protein